MTIKNLYKVCGILLFGAAVLTSCDDEETYDIDGSANNLVYMNPSGQKVTECTLYHTPIGDFGAVTASIPVKMQYASDATVLLSAEVDNQLVQKYNDENNATCVALPADVVSALDIVADTIKAGTNVSTGAIKVTIPATASTKLTEPEYVVPLRIKVANISGSTERPIASSDEMGISYLVVHTTANFAEVSGSKTAASSIVNTPVGVFGGVSGSFVARIFYPVDSDIKVSATVDNSLVGQYNIENNTNAKTLPAEVISALVITPGTIVAGKTSASVKVEAPVEACASCTEPLYVLPLRLTLEYTGGVKQTLDEVVYIKVETMDRLLQDKPTAMLGTAATSAQQAQWTAVSSEGLEGALNVNGWLPLAKGQESASFVCDLGESHKFSAFKYSGNTVESLRIWLSEDNANWTDIGSTEGVGTYRENYSSNWYVLYGAVPCRYVKCEVTFDSGAYYWNYWDYSWGKSYCSLKFNFAFND